MRLGDLILVLGPIVLIAFALGVIDAELIRVIVITAVVAGGGYYVATRLAGRRKGSGRSRGNGRTGEEEDKD
jgi:hypothetical protein